MHHDVGVTQNVAKIAEKVCLIGIKDNKVHHSPKKSNYYVTL